VSYPAEGQSPSDVRTFMTDFKKYKNKTSFEAGFIKNLYKLINIKLSL
jgi:hypothetical protein